MSSRPQPLTELPADLAAVAAAMGFVPNGMKTMAKNPSLQKAAASLAAYLGNPDFSLDMSTALMAGYMASYGAGCRYCQAHTAHGAGKTGLDPAKIENLWRFETSDLFDERERAVLSFALASGQHPNSVSDAHYAALSEHFSERQVLDLVFVVSMYGFFNRWHETLATQLEDPPLDFAEAHLAAGDWQVGKHGPGD